MKEIKLTRGQAAIVDDEDFEYLSQFKWFAQSGSNSFYACRNVKGGGTRICIQMHREILGVPPNKETDHQDANGLNNQKFNLRICNRQQNNFNRRKPKINTSGFKGAYWHRPGKFWYAQIKHNNISQHLGVFKSAKEAASAYDAAAIRLHGEFAKLNFPYKQKGSRGVLLP